MRLLFPWFLQNCANGNTRCHSCQLKINCVGHAQNIIPVYLKLRPSRLLVNISAIFWWVQIGADKWILWNWTLTVTCLTVSWVKSLPFATAKVAVLSTHTIVLSMYVGSSCLHCRSNIIALKYLTSTATLATEMVSAKQYRVLLLSDDLSTRKLPQHS